MFVCNYSSHTFVTLCIYLSQGIKRVHHKKKFHSAAACCYASVLESPGSALILLFSSGKIEIRWPIPQYVAFTICCHIVNGRRNASWWKEHLKFLLPCALQIYCFLNLIIFIHFACKELLTVSGSIFSGKEDLSSFILLDKIICFTLYFHRDKITYIKRSMKAYKDTSQLVFYSLRRQYVIFLDTQGYS